MDIKPILCFEFDIKEYQDEIKMKGYCNGSYVILPGSTKFKVIFYDPIRLAQDIIDEGYIAHPGLIVINEVTIENMEMAVYGLWLDGFFESFNIF